jgi:1,4-alpha-glucan branching enzyme
MKRLFASLLVSFSLLAACGPQDASIGSVGSVDQLEAGLSASTRPGMGAIPYTTGTMFRVWAPDAESVAVAGDWNAWSATRHPLKSEGNGNWSADVPGARPGHQYKFVITSGGQSLWRADPRARQISSGGNGVIYDSKRYAWKSTSFSTPPFNDQVLYELHIGTFTEPGGPGTGTWAAAAARLPELAALGVNVLEVLPPNEFPGDYSWGYNPSFPFAAEACYGSPDDAKSFVDRAHALGMGVVVDIVHNHYGPSDLSMWCFDGPCFGDGNGGIYFYTGNRRETGFGPRPDFGRAEVRDFVVDNAMMWLEEFRADGLRWDSTVNMRKAGGSDLADGWGLLQRMNDTVDGRQSWKMMIAEDLQNDDWVTRPTSRGGAGFDSQWDPNFFWPMKSLVTQVSDSARSMWAARDLITHGYNGNATQRVIFTENHDEVAPQNGGKVRLPEEIDRGHGEGYWAMKRSTLAAAVMLTSPGVPMLFMGQENLDLTPFPFSRARGIDPTASTRHAGIHALYSDLIHLRRNWYDNTRGLRGNNTNVFHVNDADKVIAWHRWDQGGAGDDVVVIANFSARAFPRYDFGVPRGGRWQVRFNSDWQGYAPEFNGTSSVAFDAQGSGKDGLPFTGSVGLGPYSVVILSQ